MSGRKLCRLKAFSPNQCSKLQARGIFNCKDFLMASVLELMSVLSLSYWQLQPLTLAVSQAAAPQPNTVLSLFMAAHGSGSDGRSIAFIPTSLHMLDAALQGGLPRGTITELAGSAGSGKTQLCVTLSVVTALPPSLGGCGLGVVYIDTEATFSAERLVEVAKARHSAHFSDPQSLVQLANKVKVHRTLTSADLERQLAALEEELVETGGAGLAETGRVGLVVVDSVASPVRREFDTQSGRGLTERAALLSRHAARLKYLAEAFNVAVVVTNQITIANISHDRDGSDWSESGGSHVTAALGNTWAHCVNTRLLLGYLPPPHRMLTVGKSPVCACENYVISLEQRGVVLDRIATMELQSGPPGSAVALQVRSDLNSSH